MDGWRKTALTIIAILVTLMVFVAGRYSISGSVSDNTRRLDKLETVITLSLPNIADDTKEIKDRLTKLEQNMSQQNNRGR